MMFCEELESLPSNFFNKLASLEKINLSVLRFKELPEILELIEKLPSSIGNLKGLKCLHMDQCRKRVYLPGSFIDVENVTISNCKLKKLSEDSSFLSSIETLDLSENTFERIPVTVKQVSRLRLLFISNIQRLQSMSELSRMEAHVIRNCLNLDEDKCPAVANALLRSYLTGFRRNQMDRFKMIYPGNRIPEWVKYQSMGDSIQILLPSNWFSHLLFGFAIYVCLDCVKYDVEGDLRCDCYFGDNHHFSFPDCGTLYIPRAYKEQMVVLVVMIRREFCEWVRKHCNSEEDEALFKFTRSVKTGIKTWGVIPLYAQKDEDDCYVNFDFPTSRVSKLKRSSTSAESFHCMPKKLKMEEVE